MGYQNTKSHAGHVQDPFGYNKAHREKQVGCRDKRKDDQRQCLKETKKKNKEIIKILVLNEWKFVVLREW